MGLDIYLYRSKDDGIQKNSKKYPNHYFKIGYFRSAYNSWGLNRILGKTIGKDLYYIFEPPTEKYDFKPNWEDSRMKCLNVIEEFRTFVERLGNVDVMTISERLYSDDGMPKSDKGAIDLFLNIRNTNSINSKSFINRDGHFYLDGIKCYAFIPGEDVFGHKCTYIIYEPELTEEEKNDINPSLYKDYIKCLEIVLETIEYVLEKPIKEIKKYSLHWSA